MTIRKQILYVKSIDIIAILFINRSSLIVCNIVYTLDYNFNLILFGEFYDSNITHINNSNTMILINIE